VEQVHPLNASIDYSDCDRCHRAFETVVASTLTLFQQVMTGDGWSSTSVPLILNTPAVAIFLIAISISSMGVMNLILAVIVERAAEKRIHNLEMRALQEKEKMMQEKLETLSICAGIDVNGDGLLDRDEFETAWASGGGFRSRLQSLEANTTTDLDMLFRILDKDDSGQISYFEFVDKIYGMEGTTLNVEASEVVVLVQEIRQCIKDAKAVVEHHSEILPKQFQLVTDIENKVDELLVKKEAKSNEIALEPLPSLPPLMLEPTEAPAHFMLKVMPEEVSVEKELGSAFSCINQQMKELNNYRKSLSQRVNVQSNMFSHISSLLRDCNRPLSNSEAERVREEIHMLRNGLLEMPSMFQNLKRVIQRESVVLQEEGRTLNLLDSLMIPEETRL